MIIGTGVDLVNIDRIKNAIEKYGVKFFNKIFTVEEINYAKAYGDSAYVKFATRFAAKEACLKALGTGYAAGIGFKDIEVIRRDKLPPRIELHGKALEYLSSKCEDYAKCDSFRIFLSLSDDGSYAVASVVIECE